MLEIVLTREDANTESALLAEWLVPDRAQVARGQPVCVVETTKATVEIEAPGAGTLVQLYAEGVEVELGKTIAYVAESAQELASLERDAASRPAPAAPAEDGERRVTRKARELAARHGLDLSTIEKRGFVTERDVEELLAREARAGAETAAAGRLAGVSLENVTLPASFELPEDAGALDPAFLDSLRADPEGFRALPAEEKLRAYREHGALVGQGVELGEGALLVAPRLILGDGVELGARATVRCEEVAAFGELTRFAHDLELTCRRAYVGAGVWGGRSVRFGGGGHRDPWAVLAVGDLAFVGDETFVNVCRPVLIGREAYLTQRAMIVTHNIGHSVLEGFENRFAPVVLEDRAQVGLGAVVYAGCRVGREAIVASSSYVTADVPVGAFAIGVPARVSGRARHEPSEARRAELARRFVADLHELLALRGHPVGPLEDGAFELEGTRVLFARSYRGGVEPPAVVLALEVRGEVPEGVAVLDLLGRRVHGSGGPLLDAARELCRKRGIRMEPGPWRYRGGLV